MRLIYKTIDKEILTLTKFDKCLGLRGTDETTQMYQQEIWVDAFKAI